MRRNQSGGYYYGHPPGGSGLEDLLERIKQPPVSYILLLLAFIITCALLINGSRYGIYVLILLVALPIHEFAHAITAYRLGDVTPKYDGRLTLNPLAHLDPFGSLLILVAGLGWAKPVLVNPIALRPNARTGMMIVAIAGPISNVILAVLAAILWWTVSPALQLIGHQALVRLVTFWLFIFAQLNMALAFFNMIPLGPLDGFKVLRGLVPYEMAYQMDKIQPYSMFAFLLLFLFGGPILEVLIWAPANLLSCLLFANIRPVCF
jgi:Zn-dependent protease